MEGGGRRMRKFRKKSGRKNLKPKAKRNRSKEIKKGGSKMVMDGCPGASTQDFRDKETKGDESGKRQSQLRQWPIQLHLVSPMAPYYEKADVLLSADCVAYSVGDFHKDYLKGKSIAIACPKLDEGQDEYVEKIKSLKDDAKINTLTVMTM